MRSVFNLTTDALGRREAAVAVILAFSSDDVEEDVENLKE